MGVAGPNGPEKTINVHYRGAGLLHRITHNPISAAAARISQQIKTSEPKNSVGV